jgi:cytochrome c-type biogenesis protein CcmH/NrfG
MNTAAGGPSIWVVSDGRAGIERQALSLERALRIEPRNAWLWLELAQLRLAQGQYAQAITLAGKSNSFAGHQPRVQAANWQVIGQARVAQGDSSGAEQAFKLAADFAQQAKAEADQNSGFNSP